MGLLLRFQTKVKRMNSIKVLAIVTLTLSIITVCKPIELIEGDYFLLLKDKEAVSLNTYESNEIKENTTFTISEKSIFTTDQKEKVAILDPDKKVVTLYEIQTSKEITLSIPYDIKPKTILINGDNLFIGGEMGKEILVQYHIQSEQWYQLEIPKEVNQWGKAIDDLVVSGNQLIAIDNVVLPKYILFYKLKNATKKLAFSHFKELKSNGTWEHISQGRITPNYLGLRSSTSGMGGTSENITIYNDLNLKKSFAISAETEWWEEENTHTFNDFLIIDNKIVIASKENGLGLFEIKNSYFTRGHIYNRDIHSSIDASNISYKEYRDENIIRLTQIPNTRKIVLTIEINDTDIRREIIEI